MGMRADSMPVAVGRKAMSFGWSGGRPALRMVRAIPRRRKISIVRAAMWLHFTLGGSSWARCSTTVTSMPRQARSMARVVPTGPAPMIRTEEEWRGISGGACGANASHGCRAFARHDGLRRGAESPAADDVDQGLLAAAHGGHGALQGGREVSWVFDAFAVATM